jgi:hypothetical protein
MGDAQMHGFEDGDYYDDESNWAKLANPKEEN